MKLTIIITLLTLLSQNIFAGDKHQLWSNDSKAFEYTKAKLASKSKRTIKNSKEVALISIDEQFFSDKLKQFSGAEPIVLNGRSITISERGSKDGIDNALEYLKQEYELLGYQTEIKAFGSLFSKGKNFIATKKGSDSSKVIIISSHIDSVSNAGANDNGTGTIGALAIAKALAPYEFKYDLRFVGFDKEESGLVGSKAYVKSLSKAERDKIIGVINFEMMGTNSRKDGHFHIIDCDRTDSVFMTEVMENVIAWNKIELTKVPGCTNRSDHASFWNQNIPAIVISENFFGGDSDRCYHKKCDRYDSRLDFSYMEKIASTVASTAYELLSN